MVEVKDPAATTKSDEVPVSLLIDLLSEPLGLEKSQTVVHQSLESLGLFGQKTLDRARCREVLDAVAKEGGLVAIASRLAKIKLIAGSAS